MNGLDLARAYWKACAPALFAQLPHEMARVSVGLSGEGSECFGFDDELSQDHDFGPRLCLWLSDEDCRACGAALQRAYESLPARFLGYGRPDTTQGGRRSGVFSVGEYFARFIGRADPPGTLRDWLAIRQEDAAAAVNGEVFYDECAEFSRFRSVLRSYYPEDVRRKKLAHQVALMAQAGQYNLPRAIDRGDRGAAFLAAAEFAHAAIRAAHLLDRSYAPFYKWAFRSLRRLPSASLADGVERALLRTAREDGAAAVDAVERACAFVAERLRAEGVAASSEGFLLKCAHEVQESIGDPGLRRMPLMCG